MTSSHHALNAALEAAQALANVEFETLQEMEAFYQRLPEVYHANATAVRAHADRRAAEDPLHTHITNRIHETAQGLDNVAAWMADIPPTMRAAHAHDFDRIENPRPGEEKADKSRNP